MGPIIINLNQEVTGEESVSLDDAKDFCYIDFPDQDDLISTFISAARKHIEKKTSLSLIEKTITCAIKVKGCGSKRVPYGPVTGDISVQYQSCLLTAKSVVTGDTGYYAVVDGDFPVIEFYRDGIYHLSYNAGYTSELLPADLRTAWLQLIAAMYENRGQINGDKALIAENLIQPHKRVSWLG